MQYLECNIGTWKAQARIQEADGGKIMAVISTRDQSSANAGESVHTLVFDHEPGSDRLEETKMQLKKILQDRYGSFNTNNLFAR